MLGNFKALHQIEAPTKVQRRGKVGSMKVIGIDKQVMSVDVGSVDPGYQGARSGPDAQPCTLPASEIDDTADRQNSGNLWHDPLGGPNSERRKEAVEVCLILVHWISRVDDKVP